MSVKGLKFGDVVVCQMPEKPHLHAVIIGQPNYGNGKQFVISDGWFDGKVYHEDWLTGYGNVDLHAANRLRNRYLEKYPGGMKAEAFIK